MIHATYKGPIGVALSEIDDALAPASQMRASLDDEAVEQYGKVLGELPPVKLMYDREQQKHWVVDGAHTITAHKKAGKADVQAMVCSDGDFMAAWELASHENQYHGVRITNADKRARVQKAAKILPDLVSDWPWSERRLAEFCGVSNAFINKLDVLTVNTSPRTDTMGRQFPAPTPSQAAPTESNGHSDTNAPPTAPEPTSAPSTQPVASEEDDQEMASTIAPTAAAATSTNGQSPSNGQTEAEFNESWKELRAEIDGAYLACKPSRRASLHKKLRNHLTKIERQYPELKQESAHA